MGRTVEDKTACSALDASFEFSDDGLDALGL